MEKSENGKTPMEKAQWRKSNGKNPNSEFKKSNNGKKSDRLKKVECDWLRRIGVTYFDPAQ